jgi:hypothetical protein
MMTWIKNHPAQTAVAALSLSLAASTVELYREHASLPSRMAGSSVHSPSAATLDVEGSEAGRDSAAGVSSRLWQTGAPKEGRLFAAKRYVVLDGQLQRLEGKMFRPPVPNDWLLSFGLDPLASDVLSADPDKDGFTTLQEWEGADAQSHLEGGKPVPTAGGGELKDDSTNPVEAAVHPPYHTRLVLERVEQIPFHLRFLSHDTDSKNPLKITVQINAVPGRSEFVEVGQPLKHAPFDVRSFARKDAARPDGTAKDVSEVVVIDRRTGEQVTLPKGEVVNSPESYAILRYDWAPGEVEPRAKEPVRLRLRKNETFRLAPEALIYRVAQIRPDGVDLVLPDGGMATVRPPRKP